MLDVRMRMGFVLQGEGLAARIAADPAEFERLVQDTLPQGVVLSFILANCIIVSFEQRSQLFSLQVINEEVLFVEVQVETVMQSVRSLTEPAITERSFKN